MSVFYFRAWNIRVLVQGWVQFTSDIDWILDPRSAWCIGAVWDQHTDNGTSEALCMYIIQQFLFLFIEPCVLATFVASCEDIFCNDIFLFVVYDGFTIKGVVAHMGLVDDIICQLEV